MLCGRAGGHLSGRSPHWGEPPLCAPRHRSEGPARLTKTQAPARAEQRKGPHWEITTRIGENVFSDSPLRESQGEGKANPPRKTVAAICLQYFPPEKEKLGVSIHEMCQSLTHSSFRRPPSPFGNWGSPSWGYWPSYRLWIETHTEPPRLGRLTTQHLPLLLHGSSHHLPAIGSPFPKPGPLGVTPSPTHLALNHHTLRSQARHSPACFRIINH